MIQGVKIKKITSHKDERGYFREILRDDDKMLSHFGQTSVTYSHPGILKAWHFHKKQDDLWYLAKGKALVGLYDMRKDSPTFQKTQSLILSEDDPKLLFIPIGVAHGYKVIGNNPVLLFYHTTMSYNAKEPDEGRISADSSDIPFDWNQTI